MGELLCIFMLLAADQMRRIGRRIGLAHRVQMAADAVLLVFQYMFLYIYLYYIRRIGQARRVKICKKLAHRVHNHIKKCHQFPHVANTNK